MLTIVSPPPDAAARTFKTTHFHSQLGLPYTRPLLLSNYALKLVHGYGLLKNMPANKKLKEKLQDPYNYYNYTWPLNGSLDPNKMWQSW